MKANEIMTSAKRTFSKVGFGLQKKSPEILVGVGIVGAVASAVLACKATTKAGAIVEESKNSLADIREANENGVTKAGESYSAEDRRKDLAIAYVQTGVKFAKLYAPAVMLGAVSIASILASHNIMKKRNVALAAAYAAVDKSFKDYRDRVIERFGEQVEKELRYNIKAQEIEETVTDDKGKEKKVKQNVNVADENWDGSDYGPYAKVFDDTHSDWKQDPEMNLFYLRARQAQANDTREEIELLALCTMAEAEGECEQGQRLVIDSVLNRVDNPHFPDTISEVIWQKNQYAGMYGDRITRCYVKHRAS